MTEDPFELNPVDDPFAMADASAVADAQKDHVHRFSKGGFRCLTDERGSSTPNGLDLTELKLDKHLGFIPLWAKDVTLRWRFKESALAVFKNPEAAKLAVRNLMKDALKAWGAAVPVAFSEQRDNVDFEVVILANPDCDQSGCVLASAFFPDSGRHELNIYPTLFSQDHAEQIETLAHEFGHVFGLRHWFANISETGWGSVVFGNDSKFTIMNYGDDSQLTDADKSDLQSLYQAVWSGQLTSINGTPIRLFKPYSSNL